MGIKLNRGLIPLCKLWFPAKWEEFSVNNWLYVLILCSNVFNINQAKSSHLILYTWDKYMENYNYFLLNLEVFLMLFFERFVFIMLIQTWNWEKCITSKHYVVLVLKCLIVWSENNWSKSNWYSKEKIVNK